MVWISIETTWFLVVQEAPWLSLEPSPPWKSPWVPVAAKWLLAHLHAASCCMYTKLAGAQPPKGTSYWLLKCRLPKMMKVWVPAGVSVCEQVRYRNSQCTGRVWKIQRWESRWGKMKSRKSQDAQLLPNLHANKCLHMKQSAHSLYQHCKVKHFPAMSTHI